MSELPQGSRYGNGRGTHGTHGAPAAPFHASDLRGPGLLSVAPPGELRRWPPTTTGGGSARFVFRHKRCAELPAQPRATLVEAGRRPSRRGAPLRYVRGFASDTVGGLC